MQRSFMFFICICKCYVESLLLWFLSTKLREIDFHLMSPVFIEILLKRASSSWKEELRNWMEP